MAPARALLPAGRLPRESIARPSFLDGRGGSRHHFPSCLPARIRYIRVKKARTARASRALRTARAMHARAANLETGTSSLPRSFLPLRRRETHSSCLRCNLARLPTVTPRRPLLLLLLRKKKNSPGLEPCNAPCALSKPRS